MKSRNIKIKTISTALLVVIFALAITSCQKSDYTSIAADNAAVEAKIKAPDVPAIIAVPAGNKVLWRAFATGTQIYKVTQSTTDPTVYLWSFVAPSATLYSNSGLTNAIGLHYIGPTWSCTTGPDAGKFVIGVKLQGITQDVTAVPWLLLQSVPNSDPNYFTRITYIQRINTTGGLAPTTGADAAHLGEQVEIPYTATYYFYGAN
ncbi:MAG TPA: DUF3455 domain-containing protein [Chitinophagales bacterium]|nr:DUF3455 domain-containing protein [Chitinophagales bacterium]